MHHYIQRIPHGPSNLQAYLTRDENFEQLPLNLRTNRGGQAMIDEWEEQWRKASVKSSNDR